MPRENPAKPRFEWILHRYPPAVVFRTLRIWLLAVGADDEARYLNWEYSRGPGSGVGWEGGRNKPLPAFRALTITPRAREELMRSELQGDLRRIFYGGEVPAATPYDRYIPWVAQFLNGLVTKIEAGINRIGVPIPPAIIVGVDPLLGDSGPLTFRRDDPLHPHSLRPGHPLVEAVHGFNESRAALANEFRALADYARATGLDLNRIKTPDELGEALAEARDWGRERALEAEHVPGELLYTFPDGWTVEELTTPAHLAHETKQMRHCIEDYAELDAPERRYYSLRDPTGRSQVTIEHVTSPQDDSYVEVKAFANAEPYEELVRRVACFRLAQPPAGTWIDTSDERYRDLPGFVAIWEDEGGDRWTLFVTKAVALTGTAVGNWIWDLIPAESLDYHLLDPALAEADRRSAGSMSVQSMRRRGAGDWDAHYQVALRDRLEDYRPIVGKIHAEADDGEPIGGDLLDRSSVAWLLWSGGYGGLDRRPPAVGPGPWTAATHPLGPAVPGQAIVGRYANESTDDLVKLLVKHGLFHPEALGC